MGGNQETEVAQNLRAEPVTQSDIFEPNQVQLRSMKSAAGNLKAVGRRLCRPTETNPRKVLLRLWFPIR
jgi:hypothetical protein